MGIENIGLKGVDWIHLALRRDWSWNLPTAVINLLVS
jgi:hypothetical protein